VGQHSYRPCKDDEPYEEGGVCIDCGAYATSEDAQPCLLDAETASRESEHAKQIGRLLRAGWVEIPCPWPHMLEQYPALRWFREPRTGVAFAENAAIVWAGADKSDAMEG
jgi:hypothetical protein